MTFTTTITIVKTRSLDPSKINNLNPHEGQLRYERRSHQRHLQRNLHREEMMMTTTFI